jgi:hypothetical protein
LSILAAAWAAEWSSSREDDEDEASLEALLDEGALLEETAVEEALLEAGRLEEPVSVPQAASGNASPLRAMAMKASFFFIKSLLSLISIL